MKLLRYLIFSFFLCFLSYYNFRELQQAKEKANQSYQELLQLRNSVVISSTASGFSAGNTRASPTSALHSSLSEAEQLLHEFHSTLTSSIFVPPSTQAGGTLPPPTFSSSSYLSNTAYAGAPGGPSMTSMGSTSQSIREEEMTQILEKYSDRLLELVLKKINK